MCDLKVCEMCVCVFVCLCVCVLIKASGLVCDHNLHPNAHDFKKKTSEEVTGCVCVCVYTD